MMTRHGVRKMLESLGPLQLFRIVAVDQGDGDQVDDGPPGEGPRGEWRPPVTELVGPVPMALPDGTTTLNIVLGSACRPQIGDVTGYQTFAVCSIRDGRPVPAPVDVMGMVNGDSFTLGGPPPGELHPDDPRVYGVRLELGARGLADVFTADDLAQVARAAKEGPRLLAGAGGIDSQLMRQGGPWDTLVELLAYAAERAAAAKAGRYVDQPIPGRPPQLT